MPTKTKKKPSKPKPDPVLACLIDARKRITPKGAWCQGEVAKDKNGAEVGIDSPRAVAWCMLGATGTHSDASSSADLMLAQVVPGNEVTAWNDAPGRTQKEVLALFDKAIALRRKEATK